MQAKRPLRLALCMGALLLAWASVDGAEKKSRRYKSHKHTFGIRHLALSQTGRYLVSAGATDHQVHLWDTTSGERLRTHALQSPAADVFFLADSGYAGWVESGSGRVTFTDVHTGKLYRPITAKIGLAYAAAPSADGTLLAIGCGSVFNAQPRYKGHDEAQNIYVHDVKTGKRLHTLRGHKAMVRGLAFSPDKKTLYAVGWGKGVLRFDLTTGKRLKTIAERDVSLAPAVACLPGTDHVVTTAYPGVCIFKPGHYGPFKKLKLRGKGFVRDIVLSPDGSRLFVVRTEQKTVTVVDMKKFKRETAIKIDPKEGHGVAISGDGRFLATGGLQYLKTWTLALTLKPLKK